MDEHSELRTMIEQGKDKIEWYRQVNISATNTYNLCLSNINIYFKQYLSISSVNIYFHAQRPTPNAH